MKKYLLLFLMLCMLFGLSVGIIYELLDSSNLKNIKLMLECYK